MSRVASFDQVVSLFFRWNQRKITADQVAEFMGLGKGFNDVAVAFQLMLRVKDGLVMQKDLGDFLKYPLGYLYNHSPNPFQFLLEASGQTSVSSCVTEKNFPLYEEGVNQADLQFFPLDDKFFNARATESELRRLNYRPVGLKTAWEYLIANPDVQRNSSLAVLGSKCFEPDHDFNGDFFVPFFNHCGSKLELNVFGGSDPLLRDCRILVVDDKRLSWARKVVPASSPSDMKQGVWRLESDNYCKVLAKASVDLGSFELDPTLLCLYLSPQQMGKRTVSGRDLGIKVADQPVLSLAVMEFLLENQSLIPKYWREYRSILFWGTLCCDVAERLFVPGIIWNGEKWVRDINWYNNWFNSLYPAACYLGQTKVSGF